MHSADGIAFELPINASGIPSNAAKVIDYSNSMANAHISLEGQWSKVKRVTGSNGRRNVIIGNLLNNYIDPRTENK